MILAILKTWMMRDMSSNSMSSPAPSLSDIEAGVVVGLVTVVIFGLTTGGRIPIVSYQTYT
jgi:hypothetical protein